MLFDEESGKDLTKQILGQLKDRAQDIAKVLRDLREENAALKEKLESQQQELDRVKEKLSFFESERGELKGIVQDLLQEFEKVSG